VLPRPGLSGVWLLCCCGGLVWLCVVQGCSSCGFLISLFFFFFRSEGGVAAVGLVLPVVMVGLFVYGVTTKCNFVFVGPKGILTLFVV
jgi:hypothetical protein